VDAAEGRLDDGAIESWIETTVTGPLTLYFSYRIKDLSPLAEAGEFSVVVDDTSKVLSLSPGYVVADTGWQEGQVEIPAGPHNVRWKLTASPLDNPVRAYVDQVWTSRDPRPRFPPLLPLPAVNATVGLPSGMSVFLISSTPATFSATDLPPGLFVPSNLGYVGFSGIPTVAGTFDATIVIQNAAGQHISRLRFDVQPGKTTFPEALDAPSLFFYQADGATVWEAATGLGHDGSDAARATLLRSNSTGTKGHPLATTVEGPGTLDFWYRTDERFQVRDHTTLYVYLGHVTPNSPPVWAGSEQVWAQGSIPIPHGTQTVTWGARREIYRGILPTFYVAGPLYVDIDGVKFTPSTMAPPPQSTFANWAEVWDVGNRSVTDDTDGDGLSLLMEYATGGSPYKPNPELLPTTSLVDGHFTLNLIKASAPTDLFYFVQGNRSLVPNAWTTSSIEVLDEDGSHILARSKKSLAEEPNFHMRVRVLLSP
jgi:hypothetical protein